MLVKLKSDVNHYFGQFCATKRRQKMLRSNRRKGLRNRSRYMLEPLEGRILLSGLAVTYSSSSSDLSGLATLSYNGVELISNPQFQVQRYYTLNGDGTYTTVTPGTNFASNWNPTTDTLTYTYSWGTLLCQYVQPSSTRLNMIFSVNNSASSTVTLGGLDVYAANITF